MLKVKVSFPTILLFSDAIRNGIMIQMQESSGHEWFDWVKVKWEKGDGSKPYTA